MNAVKHSGCWGVPARRLAVALSATSPRADYRAVGFPLQSLTRKSSLFLGVVMYLSQATAQHPVIEARYFDDKGSPTRIERQYSDSSTSGSLYLVLFNNGFYGLQHHRWVASDTTIDQYIYYRLPNPFPQLDRYLQASSQIISTSQNRDTLSITWMDEEYQRVGDTLLVGKQAQEFEGFCDRYSNHRLDMVLSGEVTVVPKRMIELERWEYRWVGDRPISFRIFNADDRLTHLKTYSVRQSTLVGHNYFVHELDSMEQYAIDSLSWDGNHSELRVLRYDLDPVMEYSKTLHFSPQGYQRLDSDGTTVVEYSMDTKPWPLRLIHETFEEGPLVQCQLLTFQNERLKKWVSPNGSVSIHEYKLNDGGQPVEVRVLKDGKLNRRVEYTYAQHK